MSKRITRLACERIDGHINRSIGLIERSLRDLEAMCQGNTRAADGQRISIHLGPAARQLRSAIMTVRDARQHVQDGAPR